MNKAVMVTFLSLFLSLSTFAREGGGKKNKYGEGIKELTTLLNLSEEQIAKIKEFRKANKSKQKESREEIKKIRTEMEAGFLAKMSDSDLKTRHEKMQELKKQIEDERFIKMLTFKNILTSEQMAKFVEYRKNRRHKSK